MMWPIISCQFFYLNRNRQNTTTVPSAVAPAVMELNTAYGKVINGATANPPNYTEIDDLSPRIGNETTTDPSYYTEIDDCSPGTDGANAAAHDDTDDDDHYYY